MTFPLSLIHADVTRQPELLDEEIITRDWPMPAPQEPEKSLWVRIWDAICNPWIEL